MSVEKRKTYREKGDKRRHRRKSRIRGILMLVVLVILVAVYAIVGRFLFSEKTPDESNAVTGGTQGSEEVITETASEYIKAKAGDVSQLRGQIARIKEMELEDYTEESLNNLFDYIAAAEALIAGNAAQEKMDDVSAKLEEAIAALELVQ